MENIILESSDMLSSVDGVDAKIPKRAKKKGNIRKSFNTLYISNKVIEAAEKTAGENISVESGGFLLGDIISKEKGYIIIVSEYIKALHTDAKAASLTFTHKTWDSLYEIKDEKYPDLKIIGWQHSHPGYGIFLSGYDLFIHQNFFNLPFQIAYVEDPVNNKKGFFEWRENQIDEIKGWYVY